MAGSNEVEVRITSTDATGPGVRSARNSLASLSKVASGAGSALGVVAKGMAGLAAGNAAVTVVGGVAAAAAQLAGAALLLPGAALAGGAALGTLKLATAGFGDALKAVGDPAKFAEAIAGLAPAAQDTARAVRDLTPAFDELKNTVQGNFFAGFAEHVRTLGATYLPVLKTGLGGIATEMNKMVGFAAGFLATEQAVGQVNTVLGNTRTFLDNMSGILADVTEGFLGLGAIGSEYLPALGSSISNVGQAFREWVGDNPEKIRAMIDGAIAGFQQLGGIVFELGGIIASVFRGLSGGDAAASPLAGLRDTLASIGEVLASGGVQAALAALGETMSVVGGVVADVLGTALQAIAPIIVALAPLVQQLATTLGAILTPIISALGPVLATVVDALAVGLAPVLSIISAAFTDMAPLLAQVAASIGGALVLAIQALAPIIPPLIEAFLQIMAALLPLLPKIMELAGIVIPMLIDILGSWLVPLITGLLVPALTTILIPAISLVIDIVIRVAEVFRTYWEGIKATVSGAVNVIKGILAWFGNLPTLFSWYWQAAKDAVVAKATEIANWVRSLPGKILSALGNLGSLLYNSGVSLISGFLDGLVARWNQLMSWARGAMQSLRNLWPFSPAKDGPFSGRGYVTHSGKAITRDFAESLRAGMPQVNAAASSVLAAAQQALSGALQFGALPAGGGQPRTGKQNAAAELLGRMNAGGQVFEDLSFRGQSQNGRQYNDALAEEFHRSGGGDLRAFLERKAAEGGGGGQRTVQVAGNADSAVATMIMQLIRTGVLQIG